ncbi:MAG: hypothetical protein HYV09_07345 [Deltaproteobacteria bacterium]|nr:hypothetical protein [Deltaproteobacteria bacterium]
MNRAPVRAWALVLLSIAVALFVSPLRATWVSAAPWWAILFAWGAVAVLAVLSARRADDAE